MRDAVGARLTQCGARHWLRILFEHGLDCAGRFIVQLPGWRVCSAARGCAPLQVQVALLTTPVAFVAWVDREPGEIHSRIFSGFPSLSD